MENINNRLFTFELRMLADQSFTFNDALDLRKGFTSSTQGLDGSDKDLKLPGPPIDEGPNAPTPPGQDPGPVSHTDYLKRYGGQVTQSFIQEGAWRHRKDQREGRNTLFYNLWRAEGQQRSVKWIPLSRKENVFGETDDDEQLWQNISEMFYCIAFQTLLKVLL
ncbi:uncharacterized protein F4822DRAFT_434176 [Hypoxylon trugodes]|uniref:uncharacterized protein n=1 Tax=Hypoxylon trugodes TaxID=326681 RepID=UPI0021A0AF61|nr:uncharacterized protein F4822DRAFT_434176 [Hypoxylon trugodes]KAI1384237.1 hypothetical protein F4822DRAFT_434176 [Hypoxylon trugodes]